MIRLFVTGDNHIGLKYAGHQNAAVLSSSRITAFDGMVDAANREHCALFVITGDLFENTYGISKRDIKSLFETLSRFQGTVAILPGNHDYYDRDVKVWQYARDILTEYDNILLMTEYRPYPLTVDEDDVVLYPALCTSLHSAPGYNNLGWIRDEAIVPDNVYRIGVAHGAVKGETIDNEGHYFLMTREELEDIPVDAWLIGHTHVPFPKTITDSFAPAERIFNAGTHVQTDVSCNTDGLCLIVEIDSDKTVRAKRYVSGNLHFVRKYLTLTADAMSDTLDRALADIPDNSVVDLILSGAVSAAEYEERAACIENALVRFTEGTYNDHALSKRISKELIDAEFPETSFSAGFLEALLDDPKEAQLAYELLKSLKEGQ